MACLFSACREALGNPSAEAFDGAYPCVLVLEELLDSGRMLLEGYVTMIVIGSSPGCA
jgi:hypothetical protein